MKRYLLAVALAVIPACGKQNDAKILQHEAETLVSYYRPKLDRFDTRIQNIMKRGQERNADGSPVIPSTAPGVRELGLRLQEARDTSLKLRAIVGETTQPLDAAALVKDADKAAKEGKLVQLEQLVHDTEVTFDRGITVINGNLDTVEAWIAQFENKTLAMVASAPAQTEPAAPAEPPAAPQPGAAPAADAKQPAADAKAPAAPKADAKTPAAPKADAKAPKAAPPAQPKAPAPAPAQNK